MIKLSKKNYLVGFGLVIAVILAFFPTSAFIKNPFVVHTNLKQQYFNETGIFSVSPFEAGKYFYYNQSKCYWIDVRDAKEFAKSHLKPAINQTLDQLKNSSWNPDDVLLVYGNNTNDAQEAVAYLRQVNGARAFAILGGFHAVKKYLIDPINISVTNQYSDKNLESLMEIRNKISGQKISPSQLIDQMKSNKSSAIKEGC
jgi:rhodanese-related sulfurtransferase